MIRRFCSAFAVLAALTLAAPAQADVRAKVGTFTRSTSSGSQSVTGVGFLPKAVILVTTRQTAAGTTDEGRFYLGWSDCSTEDFTGGGVGDNLATQDTHRNHSDTDDFILGFVSAAQAAENDITFTSCDSDGFTISHGSALAGADLIHYIALGGSGLSVDAGQFQISNVGGSFSVDTVGFQPKLVITNSGYSALEAATDDGDIPAIGFGDATQQGVSWICSLDTSPSDSYRFQRTNRFLGIGAASNCSVASSATLDSFDSDGFNYTLNVPPGGPIQVYYLALGGADLVVDVGNSLQPTSTGNQTLSLATMTPKLAWFQSIGATAQAGSEIAESRFSWGATDGTSQALAWTSDLDNQNPSVSARRHATDKVVAMMTPTATGSSSTTEAEAQLGSFSADQVVLNWTTADATQREVVWFVLGEGTAAAEPFSPFKVVP